MSFAKYNVHQSITESNLTDLFRLNGDKIIYAHEERLDENSPGLYVIENGATMMVRNLGEANKSNVSQISMYGSKNSVTAAKNLLISKGIKLVKLMGY